MMKKIFYIPIIVASQFFLGACDTENELKTDILNDLEVPENPFNASDGSADFSNYVAVGNSLTAGFMDGSLYTSGQNNSFPNIIAQQMAFADGGSFNQPDINSANGFNSAFSNVGAGVINGRTVLDASIPGPVPLPGELIMPFTGDITSLNNFGIPGARVVDVVSQLYGNATFGNPYYIRIASAPGTSTIIGDAAATGPSFFTLWIGNNDVLGWAISGGTAPDGEVTPGAEGLSTATMTSEAAFTASFDAALGTLRKNGAKGVVATIPEVSTIPFFRAVPYNAIPLDEATATATNGAYAAYNGGLALVNGGGVPGLTLSAEELALRTITFAAGANAVVVEDDQLTDLSAIGLPNIRQLQAGELLTLASATVLGTLADPTNPASVIGVGVALGDQYTLTGDELIRLSTRIALFNSIITARATADINVGLVDAHGIFLTIALGGGTVEDGLHLTPDFSPNGIFSTDGVHPNPRGSAIIANSFIDAINSTFDATLNKVEVTKFPGVNLL